jgi:hypothetical protein
VATREPANQAAANISKNFFETYGEQASSRSSIIGDLLKFNKGDWLLGQDEEEVDVGTKFVASMDNLLVGWVKWQDNKPVEQIMGKVAEGYSPPKRDSLGDTDKEQWEIGTDGKARDPWQFSNQMLLKPVGEKYSTDVAITFVTSSRGGIGAVGELCKKFGKEMRTREGQNPIVELGVDSYNHPNKEFGRIKTPVLDLVGWEKGALFDTAAAEAEAEAEAKKTEAKNGKGSKPAGKAAAEKKRR